MLTIDVAYMVAPWFLFIIVFGDNKYLPHAAILFLMASVNILFIDILLSNMTEKPDRVRRASKINLAKLI